MSAPAAGPYLVVCSREDVEQYLTLLRKSAADIRSWIANYEGDPLGLLRKMKFEQIGFHPIAGHKLNLIEQVNQTWTYAVALAAAAKLLDRHPDANGFNVAPGANMTIPLDIMSRQVGLVGAETFAAVDPRNNRKLRRDIAKMDRRTDKFRYVFFCSPRFPGFQHRPDLQTSDVEVWSVDV